MTIKSNPVNLEAQENEMISLYVHWYLLETETFSFCWLHSYSTVVCSSHKLQFEHENQKIADISNISASSLHLLY